MAEQNRYEFYTIYDEKPFSAEEIHKVEYTPEQTAEILKEAATYNIRYEIESQSWYEDEASYKSYSEAIKPETILVKNDSFYGCVLVYKHSYWGYREMDDREGLTAVTLDKPQTVVEDEDHSTQNGDSYYHSEAFLEKIEQ